MPRRTRCPSAAALSRRPAPSSASGPRRSRSAAVAVAAAAEGRTHGSSPASRSLPESSLPSGSTGEAMPTHETDRDQQGVGAAAKSVAEHAGAIFRLELELAAMELKRKVAALGIGIGLAIGAAVFLLFMVGFAYAAVAAALALVVPTWAALLIVTGILLLKVAVLGILALGRIRRGTPPVPEQAIREAKLTSEALKSDGSRA